MRYVRQAQEKKAVDTAVRPANFHPKLGVADPSGATATAPARALSRVRAAAEEGSRPSPRSVAFDPGLIFSPSVRQEGQQAKVAQAVAAPSTRDGAAPPSQGGAHAQAKRESSTARAAAKAPAAATIKMKIGGLPALTAQPGTQPTVAELEREATKLNQALRLVTHIGPFLDVAGGAESAVQLSDEQREQARVDRLLSLAGKEGDKLYKTSLFLDDYKEFLAANGKTGAKMFPLRAVDSEACRKSLEEAHIPTKAQRVGDCVLFLSRLLPDQVEYDETTLGGRSNRKPSRGLGKSSARVGPMPLAYVALEAAAGGTPLAISKFPKDCMQEDGPLIDVLRTLHSAAHLAERGVDTFDSIVLSPETREEFADLSVKDKFGKVGMFAVQHSLDKNLREDVIQARALRRAASLMRLTYPACALSDRRLRWLCDRNSRLAVRPFCEVRRPQFSPSGSETGGHSG